MVLTAVVRQSFYRTLHEPVHLAFFTATSIVAALFFVSFDIGYIQLPYAYLGAIVFGWLGFTLGLTFKFKWRRESDSVEARFKSLKLAIDQLREERDAREKFVATLAHDLRNALAAGKASIDYLLRHPENPVVRIAKYNIISRSFVRTDRMIQDLLDANLLQAGQAFLLKEPCKFDVKEFLKETVDDLCNAFDKRFVVDCVGVIEVCWSRQDMKRVIENLACNAKKYGATDRPITIGARREKNGVRMWVHNWGPPIPDLEQKKLFRFLERATKARLGGEQGWGIGLTLVKGIVEAHKGRVEVYSSTADGTTFHLHLPFDISSCQPKDLAPNSQYAPRS